MTRRVLQWLDQRTGVERWVRSFLDEEIPGSSGWFQALGSVVLFLLLTQAFTGLLLALNFAPTAGEAYNSLRYILREVAGGRMIRGLHHWGASMMIVVVVLHMTQVFLSGAYRKPREATWMVGVVLLLITLAFGLTGYLLPWDNRAYWGTVVTTQIAGQAPVLGRYAQRLMGAENGVGVVTFARFYSLHTLVLPWAVFSLAALHLHLVRRHGVAPSPLDRRPTRKFFPDQALKDLVFVFVAFAILFTLAAAVPPSLGRMADPTDISYTPRPDWYFLFLFQLLKFFRGSAEPIGSVVLPTLAVAVLFAVPFLDRFEVRRLAKRTFAIGVVLLSAVLWTSLTAAAVLTTPKSTEGSEAALAEADWARLTPDELAGLGYFRQARCSSCHNLMDGEPKAGPNLAELNFPKPAAELLAHFRNPDPRKEAGDPGTKLEDVQMATLLAFQNKLTPSRARALSDVPPEMVSGAQVFVANACSACHVINGAGNAVGPSLNGVSRRRTQQWVTQHLRNPKSQSPDSVMPPFDFSPHDRDLLIQFLFAMPGN